ncbi:MAG: polymer-forming cytoskeletal protein, partial [Myxococcales bacterium]|nr:polymer-forming cytoskeletal protein [Myxococcales bacterium]
MAKAPTIITASTTVDGRVEGSEDVEIYGAVRGAVRLEGDLYVDGEARVDAEVEVTTIAIHGILVGNVQA